MLEAFKPNISLLIKDNIMILITIQIKILTLTER